MKKILTSSLLMAALAVAMTGCLKDKGFENNQYGINDPDTQPPGVGFPLAANAKNGIGVDVSGSTQVIDGVVYVNLESGKAAPSDVHITLTNTTAAQIAAYNTANGTSIIALPAAVYNVGTSLTIPAGGRNVQVPLNITSTLALDPNQSYAVGLTITGVDGGYKIASNLKDLFIVFSIKNKYDGKYRLRGLHTRTGLDAPYNEIVNMVTSGPSSITMMWPANSSQPYSHPLNGGVTYYGSFTTNFIFNPTTNALVAWDMTPYPTTLTPSVGPATDSRYDPATKIIYANFYYNGNVALRQFRDTLTYLGPR